MDPSLIDSLMANTSCVALGWIIVPGAERELNTITKVQERLQGLVNQMPRLTRGKP